MTIHKFSLYALLLSVMVGTPSFAMKIEGLVTLDPDTIKFNKLGNVIKHNIANFTSKTLINPDINKVNYQGHLGKKLKDLFYVGSSCLLKDQPKKNVGIVACRYEPLSQVMRMHPFYYYLEVVGKNKKYKAIKVSVKFKGHKEVIDLYFISITHYNIERPLFVKMISTLKNLNDHPIVFTTLLQKISDGSDSIKARYPSRIVWRFEEESIKSLRKQLKQKGTQIDGYFLPTSTGPYALIPFPLMKSNLIGTFVYSYPKPKYILDLKNPSLKKFSYVRNIKVMSNKGLQGYLQGELKLWILTPVSDVEQKELKKSSSALIENGCVPMNPSEFWIKKSKNSSQYYRPQEFTLSLIHNEQFLVFKFRKKMMLNKKLADMLVRVTYQ